ncbi:MAG: glycosyltransferase family 4 protein [Firmicutes bacterium]|nr:glycosyltransferase family 4 protein [Bacillota bacterium]
MKVALVCTEKLPVPPVKGGAIQLYIDGVLPYLSNKHDLTVFGIEDPSLPGREAGPYAEFVRLPAGSTTEYLSEIARALESTPSDIVHVFNRPKWVPALNHASPESTWLLNVHNEMFNSGKISRTDAENCIALVRGIATVSDFIKRSITALYPEAASKCRVVYSGVDTLLYRPAWESEQAAARRREVRSRLGLEDPWVLLFVGRLTDKKGAHIVLKAMHEIRRLHPRIALVVVGSRWYGGNTSDDYVRYLDREAAKLGKSVVFTGFVPPSEVPAYYAAADAFVCASQWTEPLSRTIYEAMASGLPVITTSRGGNAEIIRGTGAGLIVDDYTNPGEFAHHVSYLYSNPAHAERMGRTGRQLAEGWYGWERVAADLDEMYRWAAPAKRPGRAAVGITV